MKLKDFERKYKDKGGMQKLKTLRAFLYTKNYISRHFGVTPNAVHNWQYIFFGGEQDITMPEDAVIANMIDFATNNDLKEFRFAFKGSDCYKIALSKVLKDIYGAK